VLLAPHELVVATLILAGLEHFSVDQRAALMKAPG